MSRIVKAFVAVLVAVLLAGCGTTTVAPPPGPTQAFGRWVGDAYVNSQYAGAIAAHYDTKSWAWCLPSLECIVGYTSGWDLVDAVGERATGTYTGSTVKIYYNYYGDILTATLYRDTGSSMYSASLDATTSRSLQEALEDFR